MSEVPRHSRALYSPADGHSPPPVPRWSRSRSVSISSSRRSPNSRLSVAKTRIRRLQRWTRKRVRSMTLVQRLVGITVLLISATLGILMVVYHSKILTGMLPFSIKLRSWKAGWLIIFAMCFCSAFPPMIGYSTSVTLAGFVYGFPNGWFIVASGTVVGSTSAFLCCRYLFRNFTRRLVATDHRFTALSLTLKHDGIKLLCAIRLCPLPYSISNGAVSTFPTVTPFDFALATALATPKLMLHIWIGARLAVLAAAEQKMDAKTKALNYCSIVGGLVLGIVTGLVIYKRTLKRAAQLEAEEARLRGSEPNQEEGLLSAEAVDVFTDLQDGEEDMGILMGDETSDEEQGDEEARLTRARGRSIGLVDHPYDDDRATGKRGDVPMPPPTPLL